MDKEMEAGATQAVIEARRRLLEEWTAWIRREKEDVEDEREELGLPDPDAELELQKTKSTEAGGEEEKTVEEVVEEVIEESEEFV